MTFQTTAEVNPSYMQPEQSSEARLEVLSAYGGGIGMAGYYELFDEAAYTENAHVGTQMSQ